MAHAVEVRLPFLKHQLVEFIFSLPPHFKIRQGWTKWILRKSMEHYLPQDVVWRKDKVGFEPPQKAWMQHKEVAEKIDAGKQTLVKKGILAPSALRHYTPAGAHAANNYDWRFWSAAYLFGH
jgi:asparagine synthase (glutamine-hydrolysing)